MQNKFEKVQDEIRQRNIVVFFLFGRCGRARQAVVPQDYRKAPPPTLTVAAVARDAARDGECVRGAFGLRVAAGSL